MVWIWKFWSWNTCTLKERRANISLHAPTHSFLRGRDATEEWVHSHVFLARAVCVFNSRWHTAWEEEHGGTLTQVHSSVSCATAWRAGGACTNTHTHTPAWRVSSFLGLLGMQTESREQGRALSSLIQPDVSWHIRPFLGLSILAHRDPLCQATIYPTTCAHSHIHTPFIICPQH